jgi:hypothetical protein
LYLRILAESTESFGSHKGPHDYPVFTDPLYLSSKHGAFLPRPPLNTVILRMPAGSHEVYNFLFFKTFQVSNTCPEECFYALCFLPISLLFKRCPKSSLF